MNESTDMLDIFNDEVVALNTVVQAFLQVLPRIEQAAQDPELKATVSQQCLLSQKQARDLGQIMDILEITQWCASPKVVGLQIDSAWLDLPHDDYATDARIICLAMKVEHYKMASCLSLCVFANVLGMTEIAAILQSAFPQFSPLFRPTALWPNQTGMEKRTRPAKWEGIQLSAAGAGMICN